MVYFRLRYYTCCPCWTKNNFGPLSKLILLRAVVRVKMRSNILYQLFTCLWLLSHAAVRLLRQVNVLLITVLIQFQFQYQTSNSVPELAVFGGVDERVDTAVVERQCRAEVVDNTLKVDAAADYVDKE